MIRVIYEKVGGMFSSHERAELRIAEAFSAFSNINPLHYNPYTQPLWRAAVTQYDRMMAPAEQKVAGKLRNEIRGLESNSKQLIRKLETLGDLIRRPSISKELVMERWVVFKYFLRGLDVKNCSNTMVFFSILLRAS